MNTPGTNAFALNPADYGLPTREELRKLRIWDMHYHGLWEGNLRKHEETMVYVERMGIERRALAGHRRHPRRSAGQADARRKEEGDAPSSSKRTPTGSAA